MAERTPYGMPLRVFLYTLDQISMMLSTSEAQIKKIMFWEGRSTGAPPRELLMARNINPPGEKPEWRVSENELKRWLRVKGYRVYDRAFVDRRPPS